jgi:hypothetical protein
MGVAVGTGEAVRVGAGVSVGGGVAVETGTGVDVGSDALGVDPQAESSRMMIIDIDP